MVINKQLKMLSLNSEITEENKLLGYKKSMIKIRKNLSLIKKIQETNYKKISFHQKAKMSFKI